MKFHYKAIKIDGKVVEGYLEAVNQADALSKIFSQGLRPVSVEAKAQGLFEIKLFEAKISLTDKVFLAKYLSLMLKVGTNLFQAIDVLIADITNPAVKAFLHEVRDNLQKGHPFYETFAKYPNSFSPVFINLVKAGEASGSLEKVFEKLSASLEEEHDLKSQIKAALIYPLLLVGLSLVILFFLVTFALPKIANVFTSSGIEPPFFSKLVFTVGLFIGKNIVFILLGLVIVSAIIGFFITQTVTGRRIASNIFHNLPVISKTLKLLALQRFASTLSSLIKSGIPILDALEITADAVGDEDLRAGILRVSRDGLSKGLTLGEAFKREVTFPKTISNLIAISEKAGHLEDILETLANFYRSEISTSIKTLVAVIEPLMLLFIGFSIGGIALAIIVPIYQLTTQF